MGELIRLSNTIQNYAWGSHKTLAQMRGQTVPTPLPEAEVWVGAHPSGASQAHLSDGIVSLADLVKQEPQRILPADYAGTDFPFLFKILAIEAPLSIQVHPSDEQAKTGFEAEERSDVSLNDSARNYKDPFSKPETVIALTDMKILTGVRPAEELEELATGLDLEWLQKLLPTSSKELLTQIIRMGNDEAKAATDLTVKKATEWAQNHHEGSLLLERVADLISIVDEKHPGDSGLLVAVVMNLLCLSPGDSAYTPDGQVHAYVSGTAIEIMNPSDNVMRAGLTPKHIDREELIKILREDQSAPEIRRAEPDHADVGVFELWDERMSVTRLNITDTDVQYTVRGTSAVLGVRGELTLSALGQKHILRPIEALLHTGSPTELTVSGAGEAYIATYC